MKLFVLVPVLFNKLFGNDSLCTSFTLENYFAFPDITVCIDPITGYRVPLHGKGFQLPLVTGNTFGDHMAEKTSLTNTVKHARCTRIDIHLDIDEQRGRVLLRVVDNGEPRPDAPAESGFGLVGMRERVDEHGGELVIDRDAGGTTLHVVLPA